MIATVVVVLVVTFANVFTIIQPVVEAGDWDSTLWMIGGPVFFSLLAMAIYQNYCSRMANKPELALDLSYEILQLIVSPAMSCQEVMRMDDTLQGR